jgi:hypothetical protein
MTIRSITLRTFFRPVIFCIGAQLLVSAAPVFAERAATETTAGTRSPTAVETNVKSALRMNTELSSPETINVEDKHGTVVLSGSAPNPKEADIAVQTARSVDGVKSVQDELERKSNSGLEASPHQSQTIQAPLKNRKGRHLFIYLDQCLTIHRRVTS